MHDQDSANEDQALNEYEKMSWTSRDCPTCSGGGLVIVFHGHSGEEVGAHCSCALGKWMRSKTDDVLKARIPWVRDIHEGRSKWLLFPPGEIQADAGEVPNAPSRAAIGGAMKRASAYRG